MYNFVDTTEAPGGIILPSEALSINGEYIENLIPGYRTLNVTGREALSPDVLTYETGLRDGATLQGKKYPARIIVVTYQLNAQDNKAFRDAYNMLGKVLDVTDALLIFNDEQDKYYTGTPCVIGEVPPGKNAVVGSFEIICTDPFKYSVYEHSATIGEGEKDITVDYNGTYKAYPILEADFFEEKEVADDGETATALTGAGDCGYVAFFNEKENIIQLGDPDEADIEDGYAKSQTLINQTFLSETAWGTTAKSLWAVNKGHIPANNVTQEGSVKMGKASVTSVNVSGKTSGHCLHHELASGLCAYDVSYSTKNRNSGSVSITFSVKITMLRSGRNATLNYSIGLKNGQNLTGRLVTSPGDIGMAKGKSYSTSGTLTVTGLSATDTLIPITSFAVSGHPEYVCTEKLFVNARIAPYTTSGYAKYYLTADSYGTTKSGWHGPTITRQVQADLAGQVGAENFTLTYKQMMCTGSSSGGSQVGSFRMNLVNEAGANIAGIWVYKNKAGKAGNLVFFVNGKKVNETPIDLHYKNTYFGLGEDAVQATTVTKTGGTISFAVGSYKRTFTDAALAEVKARAVTFSFEKYGELSAMSYNGLYWAKFVKHNCATWKQVPNKFSAHDVLEADCKTGEIYLNGLSSPNLGALGNDWEGFFFVPGVNQIGVAYSEWVPEEYRPTFKVRYREVFL